MSLPVDVPGSEALGLLPRFRVEFYESSLVAEHRRGHGSLYAALDRGWLEPARLRRALADLPLPRAAVAALESGRTSWTALLDAVRLGRADDATQLRDVIVRLTG